MSPITFDVLADWTINHYCNFGCKYCSSNKKKRHNPKFKGQDLQTIVGGFNEIGCICLIHATGGEPFFQPRFVDLLRQLTEKHYISVNTNLSTKNVYDFADGLDPGRVAFVHCSLHIAERTRLNLVDDFISKYHYLRRRGFNAYVTQVMYPPVLSQFDRVFESFQRHGIIIRPKVFRGYHRLKLYPTSYTVEQKQTILKYCKLAKELDSSHPFQIDPDLDTKFVNGRLSFTGLPCAAGKDYVRVNYDGHVTRCHGEGVSLGNIFAGRINLFPEARPCAARVCTCPYYGLRYAEGTPRVLTSDPIGGKLTYIRKKVGRLRYRLF